MILAGGEGAWLIATLSGWRGLKALSLNKSVYSGPMVFRTDHPRVIRLGERLGARPGHVEPSGQVRFYGTR